jgi:hypothetical protein
MKPLLRMATRRHIWNRVKTAWFEAFPQEVNVAALQEERKARAKLQKKILGTEFTSEQLEAFEAAIPPWKQGALRVIRFIDDPSVAAPRRTLINRYLRERYRDNPDMLQLMDEVEGVSDSVDVMKGNLQQRMLYSDSVVVKYGMAAATKIKEKMNEDAATEMRKRDPNFDMTTFEMEIRFIFEELYHEFLKHNLKYLEKVCTGEALGFFRGVINEHNTKFGVPKYTDILNVSFPTLAANFVTEDKTPVFIFTITFQEIECLVDPKDPETILDGDESRMVACNYLVQVSPHPNPDVEATGHTWLFSNIRQQHKVKQLI